MTANVTLRRIDSKTIAWLGIAMLFTLALFASGLLPFTESFVTWYAEGSEAIQGAFLALAFASMAALGVLAYRHSNRLSRWGLVLVVLYCACVLLAAETGSVDDALSFFGKVTQVTATCVGIYVVLVAGPRELGRWRRTKYDERSAEAAAAALIATEDLLDAFKAISSPGQLKGDPEKQQDERYLDYMRRWLQNRDESINPELNAFRKARIQAQVYLGEECCKPLLAVADHYSEMRTAMIEWTTYGEVAEYADKSAEAFDHLFSILPKKLPALRAGAVAALGPIARYRVAGMD